MSFDNRTRLITTIFNEPFMMLKYNSSSTLSEETVPRGMILDPSMVEGYCADLAHVIFQEKLKIPYSFLIETKYGNEIKKGVWDGMIGALVNRTADLAIALLRMTSERGKAVDFSQSFINSGISLMVKKPQKLKPVMLLFFSKFERMVSRYCLLKTELVLLPGSNVLGRMHLCHFFIYSRQHYLILHQSTVALRMVLRK
jgi:ionotropic glutamate receptor